MTPPQTPAKAPALLAIGNFDGVHLGHQYLLRHVLAEAENAGLRPAVMTFHPHPAQVLGHGRQETLTSLQRKLELLQQISSELQVVVEKFDLELARMSPQKFAERLLVDRHGARQVVVGKNFRFGHRREGNLETLRELGGQLGFSADAAELLTDSQQPISSSRIRQAVRAGDLEQARRLLGRPHGLRGTVVSGDRRGRQLGYPTANLDGVEEMLPPSGVYAGRVSILGETQSYDTIANIGVRPTVPGSALNIEAHLLGFDGDLYEKQLDLQLVARLRPERRFASLEALKRQIAADAVEASRLLRSGHGS